MATLNLTWPFVSKRPFITQKNQCVWDGGNPGAALKKPRLFLISHLTH